MATLKWAKESLPEPAPKQVWIVVYQHKYGTDVWPRFEETTRESEIAKLLSWEGDTKESEWLEVHGPFLITRGDVDG